MLSSFGYQNFLQFKLAKWVDSLNSYFDDVEKDYGAFFFLFISLMIVLRCIGISCFSTWLRFQWISQPNGINNSNECFRASLRIWAGICRGIITPPEILQKLHLYKTCMHKKESQPIREARKRWCLLESDASLERSAIKNSNWATSWWHEQF